MKPKKEDQLFYFLCRSFASGRKETQSTQDLSGDNLNWNYIRRKFIQEGLAGYAYVFLNTSVYKKYVPEGILAKLKTDYYYALLRNTLISQEAERILGAFNQESIAVIPLKGVFLAESVYQNIALRPSADIDLLIRKEDFSRTNALLDSLGYSLPLSCGDTFAEDTLSLNSLMYVNKVKTSALHLHWHLINSVWPLESARDSIAMDEVWLKAKPGIIYGAKVFSLSADWLLLYLCHHCFKHYFAKLILSFDLIKVIEASREEIDWDKLIEDANRLEMTAQLQYCFYYLSLRLHYFTPGLAKLKRQNASTRRMGKVFIFFINYSFSLYFFSYLVYFLSAKGIKKKTRFLVRTFFPPAQVMAQISGIPLKKLTPLHYLKRLTGQFA